MIDEVSKDEVFKDRVSKDEISMDQVSMDQLSVEYSRRLEVRDLRLVVAVAETGTLTAAAGLLHVSQSALSHQLRALERRLAVPIFLRSHRRMTLTDAGQGLLTTAREVLRRLAEAEAELDSQARGRAGTLRLSTACYTTYHWLPEVLRSFRATRPETEVRIFPEYTRQPLEALRSDLLDLAIVTEQVAERAIETLPIFEDEMVVLTAPEHPLTKKGFVEPADLADSTVLAYSAEPKESLFVGGILHAAGVIPRRLHAVPLTEAIIELVKADAGVACLARWAVTPHLASNELVAHSLGPRGFRRQWLAAFRRQTPTRSLIQAFAAHLADHMQERLVPRRD